MPIKIECDCGQHYAFDVEPVNGRMPSSVACPACGSDGTVAANESIAGQIAANPQPIQLISLPSSATATPNQPPALIAPISPAPPPVDSTPANAGPVRLAIAAAPAPTTGAATAPVARRPDPRLGLVDRTQAEHEARAKAMWGDSREQVISYLMIQGFSLPEASDLVQTLFEERAAAVRSNGMRKIFTGIGLICVPIIALVIFLAMRVIPLKLFAITIMIGLYGAWLLINGILMVVAPKSERGDVADQ